MKKNNLLQNNFKELLQNQISSDKISFVKDILPKDGGKKLYKFSEIVSYPILYEYDCDLEQSLSKPRDWKKDLDYLFNYLLDEGNN